MITAMKALNMKTFAALILAVFAASASAQEGRLDKAPINPTDAASLQAGARTFVNYCLSCHGAALVRYNQLEHLGLTEDQIKANLLFTGEKVGDMMKVTADPREQREWFGVAPPDLSVEARSRGADWLYTYLRGFYRDTSTPTGWNNTLFPNVAMPHVLWQLQGVRQAKIETIKEGGEEKKEISLQPAQGGQLSIAEYDRMIADLVNFMTWMAEPSALERKNIGYLVLIGLAVLVLLTYLMKAAYWQDVH
jgi:ubiquinol-cytochrome c reductase cytochrome c1 subunit